MTSDPVRLMLLLQLADSAFPTGGFAFSEGLESAVAEGIVSNAGQLAAYTQALVRRTATTDCVAAVEAARCCRRGDFDALLAADHSLLAGKLNDEARKMQQRMGRKLTDLAVRLCDDPLLRRWQQACAAGQTPGCCAVAQGIAAAAFGLEDEALFALVLYGAANRVLNAALRCLRVSHIETQAILTDIARRADRLYAEASGLTTGEIYAFTPQIDLLAALHEQGTARLFMN